MTSVSRPCRRESKFYSALHCTARKAGRYEKALTAGNTAPATRPRSTASRRIHPRPESETQHPQTQATLSPTAQSREREPSNRHELRRGNELYSARSSRSFERQNRYGSPVSGSNSAAKV